MLGANYALLHFRVCFLQLTVILLQWYKLPADTKDSEVLRAQQENKKWVEGVLGDTFKSIAYQNVRKEKSGCSQNQD
jgi:hypothetical protein